MPAEIDAETRSDIVYYAALGYSQQDIGEGLDVSRNTVRKYLEATRDRVSESDDPRGTLVDIIQNEYNWEFPDRQAPSFGDHPM
jgi:transposase